MAEVATENSFEMEEKLKVYLESIENDLKSEQTQLLALQSLIKTLPDQFLALAILQGSKQLFTKIIIAAHYQKETDFLVVILSKLWSSLNEEILEKEMEAVQLVCYKIFLYLYDQNEYKLVALHFFNALFQITLEVARPLFHKEDILGQIMDCLDFETEETQISTLELLSSACRDQKCQTLIKTSCMEYIEKVLRENNQQLKSLAAIIQTKLSAQDPLAKTSSNSEQTAKLFIDQIKEGNQTLLLNAVEGLAYLSFTSGRVKNILVLDADLLDSFKKHLKSHSKPLQYGICSIIHNMSMFKRKLSDEEAQLEKLKELAKEKVKEVEDPLNDDSEVEKRNQLLIQANFVPFLVSIGISDESSDNIKNVVCSIFLQFTRIYKARGLLVQQGLVKLLLKFCEKTPTKFTYTPISYSQNDFLFNAAQSLARLCISLDPHLAFPQSASSMVRPLVFLSQSENQLQQFESLLALTNLASMQNGNAQSSIQARIVNAGGLKAMQHLQFSDNIRIRCAATEGICNLLLYQPVFEEYEQPSAIKGKLKILMALSGDSDWQTKRAASGAIAILTQSKVVCETLLKEESFLEIFKDLLSVEEDAQFHLRAVEVYKNLSRDQEMAKQVLNRQPFILKLLKDIVDISKEEHIRQSALETVLAYSKLK